MPAYSKAREDGEASAGYADALSLRVAGTLVHVTGLERPMRQRFFELAQGFLMHSEDHKHDLPPPGPAALDSLRLNLRQRSIDRLWVIARDGEDVATFADAETALTQLEWHAVARGLEATTDCAAFHAAALTRGETTIVVVAESGSGKTTISLELLRRGWLPYGDDIVVLDVHSLALQSFRRCFHTDSPAVQRRVVAPWAAPVAGIRGYARPLRWAPLGKLLTAIILMERDPTQPSVLVPITRGEAAGGLLAAAVRNRLARRSVAEVAARVAASVKICCRLNNSELDSTLALLDAL